MKSFENRFNRPLKMGIVLGGISLLTSHLGFVPEILHGFLMGLSLAGYIVGLYALNHDITKLTAWKKGVLRIKK